MNIGILGTGIVGRTLGFKLVRSGHQVVMGSRTPGSPSAVGWAREAGAGAAYGTFGGAARFGELLFNCTAGTGSLEALRLAGPASLEGKILVDVANPLDFSKGMPPTLSVCNTDSLGEQIQREHPAARVVKALNTVNCHVMVDPSLVEGDHVLFICGNDVAAKARVVRLLDSAFGWKPANIVDLGDISGARATEMLLPLWVRMMGAIGTPHFNFSIALAVLPARRDEPVELMIPPA